MSKIEIHNVGFTSSKWNVVEEKKDFENVTKSPRNKKLADQCSIGKDGDGYFAYTHRARTKSYPEQDDIPKTRIEFINSTS
jgi:phosphoribosylaminoimidazole carboxylase (NCAIR synthetase)